MQYSPEVLEALLRHGPGRWTVSGDPCICGAPGNFRVHMQKILREWQEAIIARERARVPVVVVQEVPEAPRSRRKPGTFSSYDD